MAQPGHNFVIHEIRNETVDTPESNEPDHCSVVLIAEAFRRFDSSASYGWGADACMSSEFFGNEPINGVEEAAYSEVLGGPDGTDNYVAFVARLGSEWSVLELVRSDEFRGCGSLIVPAAFEICERSPAFTDFAVS